MEKTSPSVAADISPISLAFVGDAVFTLFVKSKLTLSHDCKPSELSRLANHYLSAAVQSKMYAAVLPQLSEDELAVAKRARNAYKNVRAKNASVGDYHRATGLEGLLGWLYLSDMGERLEELEEKCFEVGTAEMGTK